MEHIKKIGIVTMIPTYNYGGILQSFALQTILKRMGYYPETIELSLWPKQLKWYQKVYEYPKRFINKRIFRRGLGVFYEQRTLREMWGRHYEPAEYTLSFIEKNINRRIVFLYDEIQPNDYDAIIVGSDQIWRPEYVKALRMEIGNVFLDYTKGWLIKRIAYAPSFGVDIWEYDEQETKLCSELLKSFTAVSCREESGTRFCKDKLGRKDTLTVLDPTMLLSKADYDALCMDNTQTSQGELLYYILDPSKETDLAIRYISKELKLRPYRVGRKSTDRTRPKSEWVQPPVEEWLRGFHDAQFVVTDSFHGCVFSIIYGKPFIVLANKNRGVTRLETLLKTIGLENRIVYLGKDAALRHAIEQECHISSDVLDRARTQSFNFLKNSLQDE